MLYIYTLAEVYLSKNKVVKTIEAPRDLVLSDEVTQYAISHGTYQEIHDILLLSRPDYTLFDEMRNTEDFELFADLRLAGVGMLGIVHATNPIDAIQRFIGRIELGVIPHVMDTVIFIKNGQVEKVFSVNMEVKVPAGMVEADLARPIVVVTDFENGKSEFEIYSYGEETVVIPVSKSSSISPAAELASKVVKQEFQKYSDFVKVEMISNNKCVVYVPEEKKPMIIGRSGSNIEQIEKKLGLSIDVRELNERISTSKNSTDKNSEKIQRESQKQKPLHYQVKHDKKSVTLILNQSAANKETDIYVNDELVVTVTSSRKAAIRINKNSVQGREILRALNEEEKVELRQ